jgi:hypothetical protein
VRQAGRRAQKIAKPAASSQATFTHSIGSIHLAFAAKKQMIRKKGWAFDPFILNQIRAADRIELIQQAIRLCGSRVWTA